jgi:hypothetical protein
LEGTLKDPSEAHEVHCPFYRDEGEL